MTGLLPQADYMLEQQFCDICQSENVVDSIRKRAWWIFFTVICSGVAYFLMYMFLNVECCELNVLVLHVS